MWPRGGCMRPRGGVHEHLSQYRGGRSQPVPGWLSLCRYQGGGPGGGCMWPRGGMHEARGEGA